MLETKIVDTLKNVFDVKVFAHLDRHSQNAALKTLNHLVEHLSPHDRRFIVQKVQSVAHYCDSRFYRLPFVPSSPQELQVYMAGEAYEAHRNWNDKYLSDYSKRYERGIDLYPVATRHGRNADLLGWAWFLKCPSRDPETGFVTLSVRPVRLTTTKPRIYEIHR